MKLKLKDPSELEKKWTRMMNNDKRQKINANKIKKIKLEWRKGQKF